MVGEATSGPVDGGDSKPSTGTTLAMSTPTPPGAPANGGDNETPADTTLDASIPNALDVPSQLALGTLRLEETGNAITPEQIEGEMTLTQLEAIAAMQLAQEDLWAWRQ
jgi:hypothetical protein